MVPVEWRFLLPSVTPPHVKKKIETDCFNYGVLNLKKVQYKVFKVQYNLDQCVFY